MVRSQEEALKLVMDVIQYLAKRHVQVEPPIELSPKEIYRYLVEEVVLVEVPTPSAEMPAFVPAPRTEGDEPSDALLDASEDFLMNFYDPSQPLDPELFAPAMRLNGEFVSREKALAIMRKWRSGFRSFDLRGADTGRVAEDKISFFHLIAVELYGERPDGTIEDLTGPGIIQYARPEHADGKSWLVEGVSLGGFEL